MMNRISQLFSLLILAGILFSVGCASVPDEPEHRPKLGVAQNSNGIITFAISTEEGYIYDIYYEHPQTREWKAVPGCTAIRGTGEQVEVQQKFNSRGPLPAFTVRHSKIN